MSTTKLTRTYRCWNDCRMGGCPSHTATLEYQSVSNALHFADGKGDEIHMQTPELEAFLGMINELSCSRVEIRRPLMTTREQAEQAVLRENTANNEHFARECRILDAVEVNVNKEWIDISDESTMGIVDIEDRGWKVTYEMRDRAAAPRCYPAYRIPAGEWSQWHKYTQYVVEARPGPYVVN